MISFIIFKGAIKIYKLPLPKDLDDHTVMGFDPQFGFFQVKNFEKQWLSTRLTIGRSWDQSPSNARWKWCQSHARIDSCTQSWFI